MVEHIANVKEDNPYSTDPCHSPMGMFLPALRHEPSPRLDAATRAWLAGLAQAQWRRVEQGRPAPPRPAPPPGPCCPARAAALRRGLSV